MSTLNPKQPSRPEGAVEDGSDAEEGESRSIRTIHDMARLGRMESIEAKVAWAEEVRYREWQQKGGS